MKKTASQTAKTACMLLLAFTFCSGLKAQSSLSQFKKSFRLLENSRPAQCAGQSGIMLRFKNTTTEKMDFQYAIQDESGTWQTGSMNGIGPNSETGEIVQCESNGRFKWWARPTLRSAEFRFPDKTALNK